MSDFLVSPSRETAWTVSPDEFVEPEQELVFWDQGYSFHVPLVSGITPQEIVAAVEAAD